MGAQTVFHNNEVYDSDYDYIIGGFPVEEGAEVSYADLHFAVKERVGKLMDDYVNQGLGAEREKTGKSDIDDYGIRQSIGIMIFHNLRIKPEGAALDKLAEQVMYSTQMQEWLFEMKQRVNARLTRMGGNRIPVTTQSVSAGQEQVSLGQATEYTNETTLEQFFEALALVDL